MALAHAPVAMHTRKPDRRTADADARDELASRLDESRIFVDAAAPAARRLAADLRTLTPFVHEGAEPLLRRVRVLAAELVELLDQFERRQYAEPDPEPPALAAVA